MTQHLLALDQGTTSSRAMLFGDGGQVVARAQQEFPQIYPQPGNVEHDPEAIWESQLQTAREVIGVPGVDPASIAAIGVTNQRETVVLWEQATGRPVHNAIVWQSRVSAPVCRRLREAGLAQTIRERTGLVVDAYFSGTKLVWLFESRPDLHRRCAAGEVLIGTVDSFLLWRLTEGRVHATDVSNASRTLLYNIEALDWDDELLRIMNVPRQALPEVRPSSGDFGTTTLLGPELPIRGCAGDQQAATFGQCCFEPGQAKNTYGTGAFLLMNVGTAPVRNDCGLLTTIGWQLEPGGPVTYCLEGAIFIAGAVVQWLRDGLQIVEDSGEIEALARSVDDAGGVCFVPAFVGLGAPWWDENARGCMIGLTRGTERGHIARAALESMAFQTCDLIGLMEEASGTPLDSLQVDGGASVNDLLMQTQSDLLGRTVRRPEVRETTALGAAYLAGLSAGVWSGTQELTAHWHLDAEFAPAIDDEQRKARYDAWHDAVGRSRGWAAHPASSSDC